jgi:hypothetical protein
MYFHLYEEPFCFSFSKSESFREQCDHACRILRRMDAPPIPFGALALLFSVDDGTSRKHWQDFKAQESLLQMRGRPTVLTTGEVNELVDVILNAQIIRWPLSGPEVRGIITEKYRKTELLNTLYQILR